MGCHDAICTTVTNHQTYPHVKGIHTRVPAFDIPLPPSASPLSLGLLEPLVYESNMLRFDEKYETVEREPGAYAYIRHTASLG